MRNNTRGALLTCLSLMLAYPALAPAQSPPQAPAAKPAGPHLKIDSLAADLGEQWVDQPLQHVFHLHNTGDAPLELTKIVTPNDVTAQLSPTGPIAAGAEADVRVSVDPKNLREGVFEKQVTLITNDARSPQLSLSVRGKLKHYLDVVPHAIGFGKLDGNEYRERHVTIRNRSDKPITLTLDKSKLDKRFAYELIETKPGHIYELYVDAHPPYQPGTYRGDVRLKTSLPSQPNLDIGVFAIMPERIEVLPRVISIPTPSPTDKNDTPSVYVLNLRNNGEKPVSVVSAMCDDPNVKVVLKEVFNGRKYRVQAQLPENYQLPHTGANVVLTTDDAEVPALSVPIVQTARRATQPRQVAHNTKRSTPRKRRRRPVLDTVGKPAPQYDLKTMEGFPVSNRELVGHPATVLNFFAPNCPYCKRQLPKVEKIRKQFEPMGVRFVNVSERMHKDFTPDEVVSVVSGLGANSELAIDPGNVVGRRFKATGYPCLIVIDTQGVINHVVSGNKKNIIHDVTEALDSLVSQESNKGK